MTLTSEQRAKLNRLAAMPGENAKYLRAALAYIDWLERDAESLIERTNELIRKEEWGKQLVGVHYNPQAFHEGPP